MKGWFLYLSLFAIGVIADQLSKFYAREELDYLINRGILFNIFESTPLSIKIISLTCCAAFIFLIYLIALYLIPKQLIPLKLATTSLVSGICGNSLDKIIKGYTIDFIPFFETAFNFADVYILSGIGFIVIYLLFNHNKLWVKDNARKFNLVYPREQVKHATIFGFIVFASALLLGTLAISFMKVYIAPVVLKSQNVMTLFITLYVIVTIFFMILIFILGLFFSTKTAGPIYAFERFINNLGTEKESVFKVRKGDNFKVLESIAINIKKRSKE